MTDLTDQLDAIQARVDAATEGPWVWSEETSEWGDCGPNLETVKRGPVYADGSQGADEMVIGSWGHDANGISVDDADAAFIAAAPTDIGFLLVLARKQQAAIDAVTAVVDEWEAHDNPTIGTHIVREALEAKP
jgi:hypothetical protein